MIMNGIKFIDSVIAKKKLIQNTYSLAVHHNDGETKRDRLKVQ